MRRILAAHFLLAGVALAAPALAAPPPDAHLVLSGATLRTGHLSGSLALPDGTIDADAVALQFAALPITDGDLLLWDSATDTARVITDEPVILPYAAAAIFTAPDAGFAYADVVPKGLIGEWTVIPLGGPPSALSDLVATAGVLAVFNQTLFPLPEPRGWLTLASLVSCLVLLHRAGPLRR